MAMLIILGLLILLIVGALWFRKFMGINLTAADRVSMPKAKGLNGNANMLEYLIKTSDRYEKKHGPQPRAWWHQSGEGK